MKKIFLSAALVLAAVAGTVRYYNENENENEMSDLARANVKALAGIEIPGDDTEKKRLRIIPCSHSPHNRCDYSSIDIFYECQVISFC